MNKIYTEEENLLFLQYLGDQPFTNLAHIKFVAYVTETHLFDYYAKSRMPSKANYQYQKNLVERLACKLMRHKNAGKKQLAYTILKHVFDKIRVDTKINPLIVIYHAYLNTVYEKTVRHLKYGSGTLAKAVELTTDLTITHFLANLVNTALNKQKGIALALADELLAAYKNSSSSRLVSIKNERDKVSAKANIA